MSKLCCGVIMPDDEKAKSTEEGNGDKGKAGDDAGGAKEEEENAGDAAATKDGEGASGRETCQCIFLVVYVSPSPSHHLLPQPLHYPSLLTASGRCNHKVYALSPLTLDLGDRVLASSCLLSCGRGCTGG